MALLNILFAIVGAVLGGYILFVGRRELWATFGIVALATTANLLAVFVAGLDSGWDLLEMQLWPLVGIAVAVGVIGVAMGRFLPDIAALLIGFVAGVNVTLWLYDIVIYVFTDVGQLTEQWAVVLALLLILIGGGLGLWLVKQSRDEALILITMVVGVELIQDALRLNKSSSWTAIVIVCLALAGVMVQYANYLREIKSEEGLTEPAPAESSIAYFQDLELAD